MQSFEALNPVIANILNPGSRLARKERPEPRVPLTKQEEGELLGRAADAGRSALSAVGNVLDLPGSMVRDVVGPREARITSTLGDLTHENAKALHAALTASGGSVDDIVNRPLGGLVGVGLPFVAPNFVLGTGATAQRVAKGLDRAGAAVQFGKVPGTDFAPINTLRRLFDPTIRGAETPVGQAVARQHHRGLKEVNTDIDSEVIAIGQKLREAGFGDAASGDRLREVLEGVRPVEDLPDSVQGVLTGMRQRLDEIVDEAGRWGVRLDSLDDAKVGYFPRHVPGDRRVRGADDLLDARDWGRIGREDWLRDIEGGTTAIKRVVADEEVGRLIDSGGSMADVEAVLRQRFGGVLSDTYRTFENGQWVERSGRFEALAGFIAGLPDDVRRAGGFAYHPLEDYRQRRMTAGRAVEGARAFALAVTQPGVARRNWSAKDGVISVGELAERAGLRLDSGLGDAIAKGAGVSVDQVKMLGVPKQIGDDLGESVRFMTEPRELTGFVKALDDLTNLWRSLVTVPFPAFHFRNLVAGQIHNGLLGLFSVKSVRDAHRLMAGEIIEGADQIPAVRREWDRLGGGPLDARTATEILGRLVGSHGVVGAGVGEGLAPVGRVGEDLRGMLPSIVYNALIPGRKYVSASEVGRKAVGLGDDVSWLPWAVRGVGGRSTSRFAPVAAGEDVARYGEGLNRVGPFLKLLSQGVDPSEAARRVGAAQALYGRQDVTPFVGDVLSRFYPFSRFTLGTAPELVRQVLERPGGPMAQALRAGGESSESAVQSLAGPGVTEGASIRLNTPFFDRIFGRVSDATPGSPTGLGESPGGDRYLANFGLYQDDLLSFADPGRELGGRLNPLFRFPLEAATGSSLHSGGRIDDLRPSLGKVIGRVGGMDEPIRLPPVLEHAIAMSPASRFVSTAAKLADGNPEAIFNVLTGMRIANVTPAVAGRVAGDLVRRDPGMAEFAGRAASTSSPERVRRAADALLRAIDRQFDSSGN